MGVPRQALISVCRLCAGLQPTSQTPPRPMPTTVVTPEASAAGAISGEDRCTCESMTPGVAMRPSPVTIAVWESIAKSPSPVFTAPTLTTRPSLTPMAVLRTPSTGSSSTTLVTTRSSADSRSARGEASSPSRSVLPHPPSSSSPYGVSSCSTSIHRQVSPSRTRSPVVGP